MRSTTKLKAVAALLAAVALSACETPVTVSSTPVPLAQIHLGRQSADAIFTPLLFETVCLNYAPSFAGTPAQLEGMGLFQQATTGTYYHTSLNLSVKLLERNGKPVCSMVFGSRDEPMMLSITMQTQTAPNVNTEFLALGPGPGGMPMYRMTATAK